MVLTAHILIGAAIAAKTHNPILGLLLAFFSHYFADAIPHREYYIWNILKKRWKSSLIDFIKLFLDVFLGFSLVMVVSKNSSLALLGGFFAAMPDALIFLSAMLPKIKLFKFLYQPHQKTHWFEDVRLNKKTPLFWGILTQVLVSLLAISIFLR